LVARQPRTVEAMAITRVAGKQNRRNVIISGARISSRNGFMWATRRVGYSCRIKGVILHEPDSEGAMGAARDPGVSAAATALEALAAGEAPDPADVLAGALALERLCAAPDAPREMQDAAAGFKRLASGGALDLDVAGLARARKLAAQLRALNAGDRP